jgi:hypothetical protein
MIRSRKLEPIDKKYTFLTPSLFHQFNDKPFFQANGLPVSKF